MSRIVSREPMESRGGLPSGRRRRHGLTTIELTVAMLACAVILISIQVIGFSAVVSTLRGAALILLLTILWGLAYLRSPDLTRNATTLVLTVILTLAFLPGRALQMREVSRRQTSANSLRRIGQVVQALHDTGGPGAIEDRFREHQQAEVAEPASP